MTHPTNSAYEETFSVPLETGDILLLDGKVFGEIRAITNTRLVCYEFPTDGGSDRDKIGKAALQQKIKEADEVTIR